MQALTRILAIVGRTGQTVMKHPWPCVEESLRMALPTSYKHLVDSTVPGFFSNTVKLIRPDIEPCSDGFYSYHRHRRYDFTGWSARDPARVPEKFRSNPDALFAWGRTRNMGTFFWDTTSSVEPDGWVTYYATSQYDEWRRIDAPVDEFILDLMVGKVDNSVFGGASRVGIPVLVPDAQVASAARERGADYWDKHARDSPNPGYETAALLEVVVPRGGVESARRSSTASASLVSLPDDYVLFVDRFGAGRVGDLTIMAPGGPAGADLELFGAEKYEHFKASAGDPLVPPVFPEAGGIVPWGQFDDGWFCAWAPRGDHVATWGVVALRANMRTFDYYPDLSFSAFVAKYIRSDTFGTFLSRQPPRDDLHFYPI